MYLLGHLVLVEGNSQKQDHTGDMPEVRDEDVQDGRVARSQQRNLKEGGSISMAKAKKAKKTRCLKWSKTGKHKCLKRAKR